MSWRSNKKPLLKKKDSFTAPVAVSLEKVINSKRPQNSLGIAEISLINKLITVIMRPLSSHGWRIPIEPASFLRRQESHEVNFDSIGPHEKLF
jgi:hypothetical protein